MTSQPQVFMDVDEVRRIASRLDTSAAVLKKIDAVIEAQIRILHVTAFIGLVGGAALERYLSAIQPQISRQIQGCEALSEELRGAIQAWTDSQLQG